MPYKNRADKNENSARYKTLKRREAGIPERRKGTGPAKKRPREYYNKTNRRYYLKRYGLTENQYSEILRRQNYLCAICGECEATMNRKFMCIDHDHATGQVRGLLCHRCNTAIGLLKDSAARCEAAASYLKKYGAD